MLRRLSCGHHEGSPPGEGDKMGAAPSHHLSSEPLDVFTGVNAFLIAVGMVIFLFDCLFFAKTQSKTKVFESVHTSPDRQPQV